MEFQLKSQMHKKFKYSPIKSIDQSPLYISNYTLHCRPHRSLHYKNNRNVQKLYSKLETTLDHDALF